MKQLKPTAIAAIAIATLLLPAAASAHVELQPKTARAASEKRLALAVENERHDAGTEKVDVQLPTALEVASPKGPTGWTARVRGRRLVFTAGSGSAKIAGDHVSKRFRFTATLPDRPQSTLTFKVLQTYDNGEVVRWIGAPGSEEPAARLRLTAAKPTTEPSGTTEPSQGTTAEQPPATQTDGQSDDDGGSSGVTIALLIAVGAAAVGTMLWLRSRRRRRSP